MASDSAARLDAKKKTVTASERDEERRAAWREQMAGCDLARLYFVDECGTHLALSPRYAWAPRGQRAGGQVPRNWGKNTTLVAGLTLGGLRAPWTIEGAMTTDAFAVYVGEVLAPLLQPGDIVVMDNLSVHKAASIRQLIAAQGATLVFLPSYSPDFTPVEGAFGKIKTALRRRGARTRDALLDAIAQALDTITPQDALGWFIHAGYRPLLQLS